MAVYKRTYAAYEGSLTPAWSRFLILPRYSFARLWQSRFLVMFFMACFFYPLGCIGYIYLANNLSILSSFGIPTPLGQFLESRAQPVPVLLLGAGRFYLSAHGVRRTKLGLARSGERRDASVLLPTLLARRIYRRQDERAGFPAVAGHLGSGPDPVRDSGQPGGLGMDQGEPVDRRIAYSSD